MPFGSLQSPFSWMWKPLGPLLCPLKLPLTRTMSGPACVKVTVPRTWLPLRGSSTAVAVASCCAAGPAQPAAMPANAAVMTRRFMESPLDD